MFGKSFTQFIIITSFVLSVNDITGVKKSEKIAQSVDVIVASRAVKICQLVGDFDHQKQQPTQNLTNTRYKLESTDLGVPFKHKDRIYILFGDTNGPKGGDAIAYTTDKNPEDGLELTFLHDKERIYAPINIPGISQKDFEVPIEGVSVNGKMYIYHTTDHTEKVSMGRSVVAVSNNDDEPNFTYLYDFSKKYFINVSIVKINLSVGNRHACSLLYKNKGGGLVIFGSGIYRQSDVYLAFQPVDKIESKESILYFAGVDTSGMPIWSKNEDDCKPLFHHPCVGELSVSYNKFIKKWIMLYNGDKPSGIILRTADNPWGKWSEPQVVFDPWKDKGYGHFMHINSESKKADKVFDPTRENIWGSEYGPYQFEDFAIGNRKSTTIYFTMSTWNPYTVVLMKTTLKLKN
jgi:hypothetical protein